MDATILNVAIYLTATFAAALVTGVAGFAFRIGCRRRFNLYCCGRFLESICVADGGSGARHHTAPER